MLTDKEILDLKIFCQTITRAPRPLNKQPCQYLNGQMFCDDWEIIEILKFLFNGDAYWGDPLPNRLKENKLFAGKEAIAEKAIKLLEDLKSIDAIIEHLRKRRASNG